MLRKYLVCSSCDEKFVVWAYGSKWVSQWVLKNLDSALSYSIRELEIEF